MLLQLRCLYRGVGFLVGGLLLLGLWGFGVLGVARELLLGSTTRGQTSGWGEWAYGACAFLALPPISLWFFLMGVRYLRAVRTVSRP
jgi:hypothetical protein